MSAQAVTLRQQRCENHPGREASARCPECARFYCRECVTEHEDRVLCASCLARTSVKKKSSSTLWSLLPRLALALLALVAIYLAFLMGGNILISVPSHFHSTGGW